MLRPHLPRKGGEKIKIPVPVHSLSRAPLTEGLFVPQSVAAQQQRNHRPPSSSLPPFQNLSPPSPKTGLFNEHTNKEETRETKTSKVCVCVRPRVLMVFRVWKRKGCRGWQKSGVWGFSEHSRKKRWKGENGEHQRHCVLTCMPYFLPFHCD